nr:putative phosphatase [Quercus suber]
MAASDLPAMHKPFENPKFIFFTDFDGTITLQDSNDYMIHITMARPRRLYPANLSSRSESFYKMMESIDTPFPECIDYLVKNIKLDPYFNEYFQWALANNIPTVILSSGMEPIIRAILKNLVGKDHDKLDIISNDAIARPGKSLEEKGGWQIKFHDDSDFGHDKSLTIRPYANLPADQRPTLFYAGDGVSDLSAARETDLLFAKKGHDLILYCVKEKIPFTVFEDWSAILEKVKEIVGGKTSVKEAAKQGFEAFQKGEAGVKGEAAK